MARKKKADAANDMQPNNTLVVEQEASETGAQAMARKLLQPSVKNAAASASFLEKMLGKDENMPGLHDYATHIHKAAHGAPEDQIAMASQMLAAQAITLDAMFAELARRCATNMSDYINASERYGRLAMKAQTACRSTLEVLVKLHQPREQTVRHVHVNEGGQAVVADQIHHHREEGHNAKSDEQSHATGAAGKSPAMLGEDTQRNGVPIASCKRAEKVPDARRDKPGTT